MAHKDLVKLSEQVWICPMEEGVQPNTGAIVTASETVLIDCGNSPRKAEAIQSSLREIGAPPVKYVIYTHHHWDHTFGASALQGMFIGHRKCYERLKEYSKIKWNEDYLDSEIQRDPKLETSYTEMKSQIQDWDKFYIKLPAITFDSRLDLYLDGITLELSHIGGNHADDSIVVHAKEPGITFVGDCFYPPPLHLKKETDTYSLEVLKKLRAYASEVYVHGHGEPASLEELNGLIASLEQET